VKKPAECEPPVLTKAYQQENCRELFISVSACRIKGPADAIEACQKDAIGEWVDENLAADEEEEPE
jgi:hypothetical protein